MHGHKGEPLTSRKIQASEPFVLPGFSKNFRNGAVLKPKGRISESWTSLVSSTTKMFKNELLQARLDIIQRLIEESSGICCSGHLSLVPSIGITK